MKIEYFGVNIFSAGFTTVQRKHNRRSNDNVDVQEKPITLRFVFLIRRVARNFSGQGRFLKIRALR